MAIAVGPNVDDGLYVPETQSWLIDIPGPDDSSGSTTTNYNAKQVGTIKVEGGGGVAGKPKRRKIGAMLGRHNSELIAAIFGGGEF